jgi:hypothetical protein
MLVQGGTVHEAMPFAQVVVVMKENHSFSNLLGDLAVSAVRSRGESVERSGKSCCLKLGGYAVTPGFPRS